MSDSLFVVKQAMCFIHTTKVMLFSLCYRGFKSPFHHIEKWDVYFIHNKISLFVYAFLCFIDRETLYVVNQISLLSSSKAALFNLEYPLVIFLRCNVLKYILSSDIR